MIVGTSPLCLRDVDQLSEQILWQAQGQFCLVFHGWLPFPTFIASIIIHVFLEKVKNRAPFGDLLFSSPSRPLSSPPSKTS